MFLYKTVFLNKNAISKWNFQYLNDKILLQDNLNWDLNLCTIFLYLMESEIF